MVITTNTYKKVRAIPVKKLVGRVTTLGLSDHPPAESQFFPDHAPTELQHCSDHLSAEFPPYTIMCGGLTMDHPPAELQFFLDHPPAEFF